jgi:hypothetical protein
MVILGNNYVWEDVGHVERQGRRIGIGSIKGKD